MTQVNCQSCGTWMDVANVYRLPCGPMEGDVDFPGPTDYEDETVVAVLCGACYREIGTVLR